MANTLRKFQYILEGIDQEHLTDILVKRLKSRYPDISTKYEEDVLHDAAMDVASFHAGAEELGTSDIGAMIKEVIKNLERFNKRGQGEKMIPNSVRGWRMNEETEPERVVRQLKAAKKYLGQDPEPKEPEEKETNESYWGGPSPAQLRFNRALKKQQNSPENKADREKFQKELDRIMPPPKKKPEDKEVTEGSAIPISGKTDSGYTWKFEAGREVPWKSDVEANTFIRVTDPAGKTVVGIWADVDGDSLAVEYSQVFDERSRGRGLYTDLLKSLSKQYDVTSDTDANNAAASIYKRLGADYDARQARHTLRKQGVAEGGAETSWSTGTEKITLQDILELTNHIKQINLPINDNLKSKLIHWDGNPKEIERINQVIVSKQFPILIIVDEQGQIDWILDGNHRLHKAIKSQAKTIPAKLIKPSDLNDKAKRIFQIAEEKCPHCNGPMFSEEMINEKKDACYYKVKSRYKVWPSAYASGALVKCRKKGASNWGNSTKNESSILEGLEQTDENLHKWFKEKWVRFGPDGKIRGACARGDDSEGKPKCLPQSKAQNLGKKGRASAAARKRREDPNPERSGKAINVATKKKTDEAIDRRGFLKGLGAAAMTGAIGKASAQEVVKWANYAAKLAVDSIWNLLKEQAWLDADGRWHPSPSFNQNTGSSRVEIEYDWRGYVYQNIHNWVTSYCAQTNSYNAKNVIDYCNSVAYDSMGRGEKTDSFFGKLAQNMAAGSEKEQVNKFVQSYRAAITEKTEEWSKLKTQQKEITLSKEDQQAVIRAVHVYYFAKETNNEQIKSSVSQSLNKSISVLNNKEFINRLYSQLTTAIPKARQENSEDVEKNKQAYLNNAAKFINDLEKVILNNTPKKDEFESINEGLYDWKEYYLVSTKKKTNESSILQGISETKGLPMPGSYEQENKPFLRKGGQKLMALTTEQEELEEKWSDKYKRSIDCNNPKGFSQRAHCQGKKKK